MQVVDPLQPITSHYRILTPAFHHQLSSKESPPPRSINFTTSGPVVTPVHGELQRAREPYPPAQLTPPAGSTGFAHGAPRLPLHPAHTAHISQPHVRSTRRSTQAHMLTRTGLVPLPGAKTLYSSAVFQHYRH